MIVGSRRTKSEVTSEDEKKLGNLLDFYVGLNEKSSSRRNNEEYLDNAIFVSRNNRKKLAEDKYKTGLLDIDKAGLKREVALEYEKYYYSTNSLKCNYERVGKFLHPTDKVETDIHDNDDDYEEVSYHSNATKLSSKGTGKLVRQRKVKDLQSHVSATMSYSDLVGFKDDYRVQYHNINDIIKREGKYASMFRNSVKSRGNMDDIDDDPFSLAYPEDFAELTPRKAMLRECLKQNVIPFAIRELLISSSMNNCDFEVDNFKLTKINLKNKGLGDAKGKCLGEALVLCHDITSLDLSGNRFTDDSMQLILGSILKSHTPLTSLNLSDNKLDNMSIDMLKENCSSIDCKLQELLLSKSDIDDGECADFMKSLYNNKSLTSLNLSNNLIGGKEEYNDIIPSFVTGGVGIAECLRLNDVLTYLDLSWNNIRKESALTLAKALGVNQTLTVLILKQNNLGDVAAQYLAHSLRSNHSIVKLDVSFCNIFPKGTLTFANVLEENKSIVELNLNGNCIGKHGCKYLLRSMREACKNNRKLAISYRECNTIYHESDLFDYFNPSGSYELDLDAPYQHAIASYLVLIANAKSNAEFSNIKYKSDVFSHSWDVITLKRNRLDSMRADPWHKYVQAVNNMVDIGRKHGDNNEIIPESQYRKAHEALQALSTCMKLNFSNSVISKVYNSLLLVPLSERSNTAMLFGQIFQAIFMIVDADHSGLLDVTELGNCLFLLGMPGKTDQSNCTKYAQRIIKSVDIDGNNELDMVEFVRMMYINYSNLSAPTPQPLLDETGKKWKLPMNGVIKFDFYCDKLPPSDAELQSDESLHSFTSTLSEGSSETDKSDAIKMNISADDLFLTCDQAETLINTLKSPKDPVVSIVETILPRISNSIETTRFLAQNLTYAEMYQLRVNIGYSLRTFTGNVSGHYSLDLTRKKEKNIAIRLAILNNLDKTNAQLENPTRDTSQVGDWNNFRNETLNKKYIRITSSLLLDDTPHGRVSFDYVSTFRPIPGIQPSSDSVLVDIVTRIFDNFDMKEAKRKEEEFRLAEEEANASSAGSSPVTSPVIRGRKTGLLAKMALAEEKKKKKMNKTTVKTDQNKESLYWIDYLDSSYAVYKVAHIGYMLKVLRQYLNNERVDNAIASTERSDIIDMVNEVVQIPEGKEALSKPMYAVDIMTYKMEGFAYLTSRCKTNKTLSNEYEYYKNHIKLEEKAKLAYECTKFEESLMQLEVYLVYNLYFSCSQILFIINEYIARKAPDVVIVSCIALLFNRIVDLDNFGIIMNNECVTHALRAEIIHRLGIMNTWSPVTPDVQLQHLNLTNPDHREAVKLFIKLANNESLALTSNGIGTNITPVEYSVTLLDSLSLVQKDAVATSWVFPKAWATDDKKGSVSKLGYVSFNYNTCSEKEPNIELRKLLAQQKTLSGTKGSIADPINL